MSDTLLSGQSLKSAQYLRSKNGVYTLQMQRTGNVTLTKRGSAVILWQSNTYKRDSVLVMGADGMMQIIYGRTKIWSLGAASPKAKLVVPDNGNLAIYNTGNKAVWNRHMEIGTLMPDHVLRAVDAAGREVTLYSVNHVYTLQIRTDGNMVLLQNGKTVLWSTGVVTGWPESSGWISVNGRFFTVNRDGDETWGYDTRRSGTVVQLRNDGHLLLINGRTTVKVFH